jgi:F-type H+-transporting ATPase subunit b
MPQLEQIGTFPSQIFWLILTFAALFVIIWKVAAPKIADALENRQRRIEDNLARAEELKNEVEAARDAYEESLQSARAEAQSAIKEAHDAIQAEAAKRGDELGQDLAKRIADAEANIAKAKADALASIQDAAGDVAASVVEKLVGQTPDAASVKSAVDAAAKARG